MSNVFFAHTASHYRLTPLPCGFASLRGVFRIGFRDSGNPSKKKNSCHFSALNQPNYLARNAKNQAFRSLIFKIFRGSMPPDPLGGLGLRPRVTASRSLYQKLTNRKPLKSPPQIRPCSLAIISRYSAKRSQFGHFQVCGKFSLSQPTHLHPR